MEIVTGEVSYKRLNRIGAGQGQNSVVWRAYEPQLGGDVVVKEIDKSTFRSDVSAYFREAQAMYSSQNPNVVPISYAMQTSDLVCLVMKFYKNGSLQDRIALSPLSPVETIRVGISASTGLGHVHAKKWIHFDVKPSNILFSDQNVPMIADFGQSKSTSALGLAIQPRMYAHAIPPEWFSTNGGSVQTDIYQLGVTLYRCVNGDHFFEPQRSMVSDHPTLRDKTLAGKFPDRDKFMPHVPRQLRTIIRKAMSVKPEDRYQNTQELIEVLSKMPIRLNWQCKVQENGEIEWRATRKNKADLIVCLKFSKANWNTEIYTEGTQRRKLMIERWSFGLTRPKAMDSLKILFDELA